MVYNWETSRQMLSLYTTTRTQASAQLVYNHEASMKTLSSCITEASGQTLS